MRHPAQGDAGCWVMWGSLIQEVSFVWVLTIWYSLGLVRRRQWHPTSVLLPGKSHGRRSLVGCSPLGSRRVGHDWATSLSLFTFMHWRRRWQPTPVFLPGESQDRGAWWAVISGVHRVRHDWCNLEAAADPRKNFHILMLTEWFYAYHGHEENLVIHTPKKENMGGKLGKIFTFLQECLTHVHYSDMLQPKKRIVILMEDGRIPVSSINLSAWYLLGYWGTLPRGMS